MDSSWWVEFQRQGALRRREGGGRRSLLSMGDGWVAMMLRLVWAGQGNQSAWQRGRGDRDGPSTVRGGLGQALSTAQGPCPDRVSILGVLYCGTVLESVPVA